MTGLLGARRANKIWNAARFLFVDLDKYEEAGLRLRRLLRRTCGRRRRTVVRGKVPLADGWLFAWIAVTVETVNDALANYRFHEAAQAVYQFFWGDFATGISSG